MSKLSTSYSASVRFAGEPPPIIRPEDQLDLSMDYVPLPMTP